MNRSNRRLARMTGRAEPDQHEMVASIQKRLVSIEDTDVLEKRYNRQGTKTQGIKGLKLVGPSVAKAAGAVKAVTGQVLPGSKAKQSAVAGGAGSTTAVQQAGQTVGSQPKAAGSKVKQSAAAGGAAGSATAAQPAGQTAGKKSKAKVNNAATAM